MTLLEADIKAARILVVDDLAANLSLLERMLADAGYSNVTSTTDPQSVCALHRQHDYDLILLDMHLPVMDGFGVMAALSSGGQDDYLPVIVVTADPTCKLRALQAGAKDFISKPFDLLEVKTRIHNMLEVRLLHRRLAAHNAKLESLVQERTAELRESEARYRSLTELASDWYWEQDEHGSFTVVSGPVLEMLGLPDPGASPEPPAAQDAAGWLAHAPTQPAVTLGQVWNEAERGLLREAIAARRPFLDFSFSRVGTDGTQQQFRVSGEPMFTRSCRFSGYRGIGVEIRPMSLRTA